MLRKILLLSAALMVVAGALSGFAAGTESDPLVTLSFLNKTVEELKTYVDGKISGGGSEPTEDGVYEKFKLITIPEKSSFIAEEGTEFILRQGGGKIIGTALGGLSNVTEAIDLQDGSALPANSLLIVPRSDGRGFTADSDTLILVKGAYTVK